MQERIRSSALWGKGGRGALLAVVVAVALALPAGAAADKGRPSRAPAPAYLPGSLLADAQENPRKKFDVIVELKRDRAQEGVRGAVRGLGRLRHAFRSINGLALQLPGAVILKLAERGDVFAITRDVRVSLADYSQEQVWPQAVNADAYWARDEVVCETDPATGFQVDPACTPAPAILPPKPATIAIVDSGIDSGRVADFGGRVVASVGLSKLAPGETRDGKGHGTFVASVAAGAAQGHAGAAPGADLVNLRVMDDHGMALTSDVIAAADWILQHKDEYGIRVANFSLNAATGNSFKFDPLDHAVERLWFSGVTVVTAAGNQGDGTRLPMVFAPANDPFVITVGAAWTRDTVAVADDEIAPFSAFGYTADGFAKPELSAPGRYMVGAVSADALLALERPDKVVAPGYMLLSGTSFAAPVVAGVAASLLGQHPEWTPDQVKGALMATARPLATADPLAGGVGEVDAAGAGTLAAPPNPNAGLNQFVVDDASSLGGKSFDSVSWDSAAQADPAWNAVSWDSVSWDSVSWDSVSWDSVSWDSVSWDSVSWDSVSWDSVAEAESALAAVSWSSLAAND